MTTIITYWYRLSGKFNYNKYFNWMEHWLPNIKSNIILYTNEESYNDVKKYESNTIKIIKKEFSEFYTFKQWGKQWIINHMKNAYLNNKCEWKLNMLWNEKINFVKEAVEKNHFNSNWFILCDIGYFRKNEPGTITTEQIKQWPNTTTIQKLDINKVYYGLVNKSNLNHMIATNQIPHSQVSIAGGFFIIHKKMIETWHTLYYNTIMEYYNNNMLIKDDQIIIVKSIIQNKDLFKLIEEHTNANKWFVFQRFLL